MNAQLEEAPLCFFLSKFEFNQTVGLKLKYEKTRTGMETNSVRKVESLESLVI